MNICNEFLKALNPNRKINFRFIKEDTIETPRPTRAFKQVEYDDYMKRQCEEYSANGYAIFFMPNTGTDLKDDCVTRFNAIFVDMDLADEVRIEVEANGEVTPDMTENQIKAYAKKKAEEKDDIERIAYKKVFRSKINKLTVKNKLKPSVIIETKNGLHVYYFLEDGTTKEQFTQAQEALIEAVDGDIKVKNPARLMRVPNYLHQKDKNNPFLVEINEFNADIRYNILDFINLLNGHIPKQSKDNLTIHNKTKISSSDVICEKQIQTEISKNNKSNISKSINTYEKNITYIKTLNIEKTKNIIEPRDETTIVHNLNELYSYLLKQNLHEFLGIATKDFNCLFHDDHNPSANIFKDKKTGNWWYKCRSSTCGWSGQIVNIVEKLANTTNYEALNFLEKVFNVRVEKTEWQQKQERMIESNLRTIDNLMNSNGADESEQLIERYPYIYKTLNMAHMKILLEKVHDIAREKMSVISKINSRDNAVVFASILYILKSASIIAECDKYSGSKAQKGIKRMKLMGLFGLVDNVGVEELPPELKEKIKHEKVKERYSEKQKKNVRYSNPISYYALPSFDTNTLEKIESVAKEFFQKGLTFTSFSRETLIHAYGHEVADKVFPNRKEEKINPLNEKINKALEEAMIKLLKKKGWTYDDEIFRNTIIPDFNKEEQYREMKLKRYKLNKNKASAIDNVTLTPEIIDKWYKKELLNTCLKRIIVSLLENYGITKQTLNKKLISNFNADLDNNLWTEKGYMRYPSVYFYQKD